MDPPPKYKKDHKPKTSAAPRVDPVDERHEALLCTKTYEEASEALSYYLEHRQMYQVPSAERSNQHVFWTIMFSLQECSKADVLGSQVAITFADLHVGFSVPIQIFKRSMIHLPGFSDQTLERILCRREVQDQVKMLVIEMASRLSHLPPTDQSNNPFTPSRVFDLSLKAYKLDKSYFSFIISYLSHEKEPDWRNLDENVCLKVRAAYNTGDIPQFKALVSAPMDADNVYLVWACLSILGEQKSIAQYLVTTRDFELSLRMFVYVSNKFTRRRIARLLHKEIDLSQFVSTTVSWFFYKRLAPIKDVIHFIDTVLYHDVGLPEDMRILAFCHCALGLYEQFKLDGDRSKVEQVFNSLTACKEDEIILGVQEALREQPIYDLFEEFLLNLLKTPYEERFKFIKGHVLLLVRDQTVQLILENPDDYNMSPEDADSLPNLLARTHMLVGPASSQKLLGVTNSIGRIVYKCPERS